MSLAIKLGVPFWRRGPENPLTGASGITAAVLAIAAVYAAAAFVVWSFVVVICLWFGSYTPGSDATGYIWPAALLTLVFFAGLHWLTTASGMWGIYNDEGVRDGVHTVSWDFTRCIFWSRTG